MKNPLHEVRLADFSLFTFSFSLACFYLSICWPFCSSLFVLHSSLETMHTVYLGLGTNLGDRRANISTAVRLLGERLGRVVRVSSLLETEPWGFLSSNMFVNAAVCVETSLTPRGVLEATQAVEREMGRTLKSVGGQYHDRIIDIDILLYDDIHVDEPDLKIPHPLMHERDFVMRPLGEILEHTT